MSLSITDLLIPQLMEYGWSFAKRLHKAEPSLAARCACQGRKQAKGRLQGRVDFGRP